MKEGGVTLLPKLLVLLALRSPHPLHHLFAQLHGRRQRLGVSTQDVAKVDVEELPWKHKSEGDPREGLFVEAAGFTDAFLPPVFVSSRLSRCRSPTPRMYVMTQ